MTLISQGAEAILTLKDDKVYKERAKKSYRFFLLDEQLRLSRTNRERKVLQKAKSLGVRVPEVFSSKEKFTLVMEYIAGKRLKDWLNSLSETTYHQAKEPLQQIGTWLAVLHDNNIMHGDLTTSNVLKTTNDLVMIDFGLAFFSTKIEDRAVDLHLFKQALASTHYKHEKQYFTYFLDGYKKSKTCHEALDRLKIVQARGKNKH